MRSGRYVKQLEGYSAFLPAPLPPDPPLLMDAEILRLLSDADRALGRLDGVATMLPNPDLFVAMYVRQEAVLSSQIEGTQSTLEDVLQFEINASGRDRPKDVEEVVNYISALNHGLRRLKEDGFPLSLRLLREIHARLLEGVRGSERTPGEFRRTQNWIGPAYCRLTDATFVPPPVHEMNAALDNIEKFLHDKESLPVLVQCALAHAQFETIHPFLDGNGRIGRLLITLMLCEQEILQRPLLYLSLYLKQHRAEYYDRLMAIRNEGNWESWVKFFLRGVYEVSLSATHTARQILHLREHHREILAQNKRGASANLLLDHLYERPIVSARMVEEYLECSYVFARKMIDQFIKWGFLREITGGQRNRLYRYEPYLTLFESVDPADSIPSFEQPALQITKSEN